MQEDKKSMGRNEYPDDDDSSRIGQDEGQMIVKYVEKHARNPGRSSRPKVLSDGHLRNPPSTANALGTLAETQETKAIAPPSTVSPGTHTSSKCAAIGQITASLLPP